MTTIVYKSTFYKLIKRSALYQNPNVAYKGVTFIIRYSNALHAYLDIGLQEAKLLAKRSTKIA